MMRDWAERLSLLMNEPVPATDARHLARIVADTISIAHHARHSTIGATAMDRAGTAGGSVTVWGDGPASLLDAAFLNGTAAEVLDFQEVLIDGRNNGHAAVVIVPVLLALAEDRGLDGERLARALRVAFAANIGLVRALGRGHRAGTPGFRTTSLGAPVAAALAAGLMLGDAGTAAHAAAICAASLPCGLLAAMAPGTGDFPVDKDLSVGFSGRHALHCALLAEAGATGPAQALTGPRGWLASYGFDTAEAAWLDADPAAADLSAYALKLYPANFGCQCAISLAIDLARGLAPDDIVRIDVAVKSSSAASLSARDLTTHVAARFSLPYAVASAALRGRSVLADFAPPAFRDPKVHALMGRVQVTGDAGLEALHLEEGVFPARVLITTSDDQARDGHLDRPDEGFGQEASAAIFADKVASLCPPPLSRRLIAAADDADFAQFIGITVEDPT